VRGGRSPEGTFFSAKHRTIYSVLLDLHREGERIDETLMAERLSRSGKLDEVGWQAALAALTSRIETSAHAAYWLKLVQEKHAGSGSNDTPNP
jgi:replicative DNA helicase